MKTFSGLRSRWTMPRPCALRRARAILGGDGHRLEGREAAATREAGAEILAGEQLHREVRDAVVDAEVEDADDIVRLRGEERGGARLAREAIERVGVARVRGVDELERDLATEREVMGDPHGAHAAVGELAHEPVTAGDDHVRTDPTRRRRTDEGAFVVHLDSLDARRRPLPTDGDHALRFVTPKCPVVPGMTARRRRRKLDA
ncbi:MAG: hypothetical protein QM820_25780 [Minicystis sp.]